MTTVLECSKCNAPVEVTARVLHFPFVCEGCSVVESEESENSEGGDMIEQEYVEEPYLDHADATVENTNALFEQIEEQLAQANADKEALIVDVQSLGDQLEKVAQVNSTVVKSALLMGIEVVAALEAAKAEIAESNAWEDFAHRALAKQYNEVALANLEIENLTRLFQTSNRELGAALAEVAKLKNELERQTWLANHFRERKNSFLERIVELKNEIADLKGRSFFQKLGDLFSFGGDGVETNIVDPKPA